MNNRSHQNVEPLLSPEDVARILTPEGRKRKIDVELIRNHMKSGMIESFRLYNGSRCYYVTTHSRVSEWINKEFERAQKPTSKKERKGTKTIDDILKDWNNG